MSDLEGRRAEQEALSRAEKPMTSRRAEVWSAMMRYLAGESRREQSREQKERAGQGDVGRHRKD